MIMSKEIKILTSNHLKTKRNYLKRMMNSKVKCMNEAKNMNTIIGMALENLDMVDINILKVDGQMLQKN